MQGKQAYAEKKLERLKAKQMKMQQDNAISNGIVANGHANGYTNGVSKKTQ